MPRIDARGMSYYQSVARFRTRFFSHRHYKITKVMEVPLEELTVTAFRFIEIVNNKGFAAAIHSSVSGPFWGGDSRLKESHQGLLLCFS